MADFDFSQLQGLLSQFQPSEQDKRDALTQGLAAAGFGILGARGGNALQNIAQGGFQGLLGYNGALHQASDAKRNQLRDAMDAMQVQQAFQGYQDANAARDVLKSYQPPSPLPSMAPTLQNATALASTQPQSAYQRLSDIANQLDAKGLGKMAADYRKQALEYAPKYSGTKTVMQNGKPTLMQEYSNQAPSAVQGFEPTPDTQFVDLGGRLVAVDKNQVAPGTDFSKSMTPGETASNQLGWANYGLSKQREARESANAPGAKPQWDSASGQFVFPPTPENPMGRAISPDGFTKTKPLTESEGNATGFGMRMVAANSIINDLEDSGFDLTNPLNLLANTRITNYSAKPEARKVQQAKLNFMTAALRKESGAAISKSEFDTFDRQYFPQPGDDAQTAAQKRQARSLAIQALSAQAGPGARQIGQAPASGTGWSIKQVH